MAEARRNSRRSVILNPFRLVFVKLCVESRFVALDSSSPAPNKTLGRKLWAAKENESPKVQKKKNILA
jgi:hypothetical protein